MNTTRSILLILVVIFVCGAVGREPYQIESYDFSWHVAESGEAKLSIRKSDESTLVYLRDDHNGLQMSPETAVEVGKVLAESGVYGDKMKGAKEELRETVEAGECNVSFWQSPKYGFSVSVREKGAFLSSTCSLDRKQALALAEPLQKCLAMAEWLDARFEKQLGL